MAESYKNLNKSQLKYELVTVGCENLSETNAHRILHPVKEKCDRILYGRGSGIFYFLFPLHPYSS